MGEKPARAERVGAEAPHVVRWVMGGVVIGPASGRAPLPPAAPAAPQCQSPLSMHVVLSQPAPTRCRPSRLSEVGQASPTCQPAIAGVRPSSLVPWRRWCRWVPRSAVVLAPSGPHVVTPHGASGVPLVKDHAPRRLPVLRPGGRGTGHRWEWSRYRLASLVEWLGVVFIRRGEPRASFDGRGRRVHAGTSRGRWPQGER